jgi:hypothetical protein
VASASRLHRVGRGFESLNAHQPSLLLKLGGNYFRLWELTGKTWKDGKYHSENDREHDQRNGATDEPTREHFNFVAGYPR